MTAEPTLTVDFGTSSTSAAVGGTLVLEPASGSAAWPSSVYLEDGELLVGTLAERKKRADPAAYRTEFKRDLGSTRPLLVGDKTLLPVELVAAYLRRVRAEAERVHGGPLTRAALTVPASYRVGDVRRRRMVEAGEAAGFTVVELLPEPVAAAFAPGAEEGGDGLLLVYDFGGGTFDTALVRRSGGETEVVGHAALDDCGGRDLDALIGGAVRTAGADWLAPLRDTAGAGGDLRLEMAVGDLAQRVKHHLTDATHVEEYLLPTSPAYALSRGELARLAYPQLRRTVDCARALLDAHGVDPAQIDAVLLVGGSSRMPAVGDVVAAELGRPVRRLADPELAVVRGAAHWTDARPAARLPADTLPPTLHPLHWAVPGGRARVHRWLVEPGARYAAGDVLLRVRTPDDLLWDLAATTAGTVRRMLVEAGGDVEDGTWLALAVG